MTDKTYYSSGMCPLLSSSNMEKACLMVSSGSVPGDEEWGNRDMLVGWCWKLEETSKGNQDDVRGKIENS